MDSHAQYSLWKVGGDCSCLGVRRSSELLLLVGYTVVYMYNDLSNQLVFLKLAIAILTFLTQSVSTYIKLRAVFLPPFVSTELTCGMQDVQ